MSLFQALVLALLQGVTELFPVSSLGHTIILPKLLGWNINQADPTFLAFVVLLQKQVQSLFANPRAAAAFLIANGIIMFAGERVRRRAVAFDDARTKLEALPVRTAVGIG